MPIAESGSSSARRVGPRYVLVPYLRLLARRRAQGDAFARDARATVSDVASRVARVAPAGRPRVYYARGPRGLETGRPGSINVEALERAGWKAADVSNAAKAGGAGAEGIGTGIDID
jgi:hypothetical protein